MAGGADSLAPIPRGVLPVRHFDVWYDRPATAGLRRLRAHAETDPSKTPGVDDVIENFEVLEPMLVAVFGRMAETMDEADDVLAEASRRPG